MEVIIETTEYYPVHKVAEDYKFGFKVDVPEEKVQELIEVTKRFNEIQDYFYNICRKADNYQDWEVKEK